MRKFSEDQLSLFGGKFSEHEAGRCLVFVLNLNHLSIGIDRCSCGIFCHVYGSSDQKESFYLVVGLGL